MMVIVGHVEVTLSLQRCNCTCPTHYAVQSLCSTFLTGLGSPLTPLGTQPGWKKHPDDPDACWKALGSAADVAAQSLQAINRENAVGTWWICLAERPQRLAENSGNTRVIFRRLIQTVQAQASSVLPVLSRVVVSTHV